MKWEQAKARPKSQGVCVCRVAKVWEKMSLLIRRILWRTTLPDWKVRSEATKIHKRDCTLDSSNGRLFLRKVLIASSCTVVPRSILLGSFKQFIAY